MTGVSFGVPLRALRRAFLALALFAPVTATQAQAPARPAAERALPRPDKVVIVVEENRAFNRIIGSGNAPWIDSLAARGALLTQSYAITHPSQPNYLALFSGSMHGVKDNTCPVTVSGDNLGSLLLRAGFGIATYSESMPSVGYTGCESGDYRRKHNPAVNWQGINIPPEANRPFSSFPADLARLPTVSIVVPDQANDMHDGAAPETIRRGDAWLKQHIERYVQWAMQNNSLLVLTFDEDDGSEGNRITTIFVGPMVKPGRYDRRTDHYGVLRTLLDLYGLPAGGLGAAATAEAVRDIWQPGTTIRTAGSKSSPTNASANRKME